jgi:hypothetical protein
MGRGIAHATTLKPRPDVVIVLTDGFTPWPAAKPPFKTIICLVGRYAAEPASCPQWATVVQVKEQREDRQ